MICRQEVTPEHERDWRPPVKSIARIILALLSAVSITGCASSGYWADRERDAMDIFTLSTGTGTGVRARVGPLGTGLLMDSTVAGWRGGEWLGKESYVNKGKPVPWNHDIQLGVAGEEDFMGGFLCLDRGKAFSSRMLCGLNVPTRQTPGGKTETQAISPRSDRTDQ
jgi:hypothetical protein